MFLDQVKSDPSDPTTLRPLAPQQLDHTSETWEPQNPGHRKLRNDFRRSGPEVRTWPKLRSILVSHIITYYYPILLSHGCSGIEPKYIPFFSIITLWWFNIAVENHYKWSCSIAMLVITRGYSMLSLYSLTKNIPSHHAPKTSIPVLKRRTISDRP